MRHVLRACTFVAFATLLLGACAEDSQPSTGEDCSAAQTLCGDVCVDTTSSPTNCGACGVSCAAGEACRAGVCTEVGGGCAAGETECGGACVNTTSDGAHCGGCNNACAAGQVCTTGACAGGESCDGAGEQMCGDACVNTQTDATHCGGCNNACGGGATCAAGACTCSGGLTYCGGECVNTDANDDHCGSCLAPCLESQMCVESACQTVIPEVCDGEDNDLDGLTDEKEDGTALTLDCSNLCGVGVQTCASGAFGDCSAPPPTAEVCDRVDNDCDGQVDEGVATLYFEDFDGDGFGDPDLAFATEACELPTEPSINGGVYVENDDDCDDVDEEIYPGAEEVCEDLGQDEDCDGDENEGCECTVDEDCGTDEGICELGTQACDDGVLGACGGDDYVAPDPAETCNGLDDDCDGVVDEELADDALEANDTCATARSLATAGEGTDESFRATLYHGVTDADPDADWFAIETNEAWHFCTPDNPFGPPGQCGFHFNTTVTLPEGVAANDFTFCIYVGECGDWETEFCTDIDNFDADSGSYTLALAWDGWCGLEDGRDLVLAVTGDGVNSCFEYELAYEFFYIDRECLE